MIRLVIEQLLNNAVRFTACRKRAEIGIDGSAGPGELCFSVKDNGIGYDMRDSHKLFHAFRRLHAEDGFAGTGVGLAIVKRVMELHGGRVWAEGKVGKGATFHFALPAADSGES